MRSENTVRSDGATSKENKVGVSKMGHNNFKSLGISVSGGGGALGEGGVGS